MELLFLYPFLKLRMLAGQETCIFALALSHTIQKIKKRDIMRAQMLALIIAIFVSISGCQTQNLGNPTQDELQQQPYTYVRQQTPQLAGGSEYDHRIPQPLSLSDLQRKYKSNFILSGSPQKREIALTFDDAPDTHFTPLVLDQLKRMNVKATFFIVGNRAEKHPDIVKRIAREGHAIGNHSYSHPNFNNLSDQAFRKEIQKTDQILQRLIGYKPVIIRPPYGNITEGQIQWLISQKKKIINWNVDSLDWKNLSAEQVTTNILSDIRPGSIVLQHSAGGKGEDLTGTVQAIPTVIKKLRADGVRFVTVPELLEINNRAPH